MTAPTYISISGEPPVIAPPARSQNRYLIRSIVVIAFIGVAAFMGYGAQLTLSDNSREVNLGIGFVIGSIVMGFVIGHAWLCAESRQQ